MANLKEIRNRITSIKSTMQITSAMKMVSAAKLKKALDAIIALEPYSSNLTKLLQNLSSSIEEEGHEGFFAKRKVIKRVLLVVVTSNRGLCGVFNSSVIKSTINIVKNNYRCKGIEVDLFTIGKKGNDILSKDYKIISNRNDIFDKLNFKKVSSITEQLMDLFVNGSYDKIEIVYNHFKNAATQITKNEQFLPIKPIEKKGNINYIFEPSNKEILVDLIPKSLKVQLYKVIRDSFASEHGARMTAMHKATDNATELRDDLLLTYNKARQAAITNEILEIVAGAEALKN